MSGHLKANLKNNKLIGRFIYFWFMCDEGKREFSGQVSLGTTIFYRMLWNPVDITKIPQVIHHPFFSVITTTTHSATYISDIVLQNPLLKDIDAT